MTTGRGENVEKHAIQSVVLLSPKLTNILEYLKVLDPSLLLLKFAEFIRSELESKQAERELDEEDDESEAEDGKGGATEQYEAPEKVLEEITVLDEPKFTFSSEELLEITDEYGHILQFLWLCATNKKATSYLLEVCQDEKLVETYMAETYSLVKGAQRPTQPQDLGRANHQPSCAPDQSAMISALTSLRASLNRKYEFELKKGEEKEDLKLRKAWLLLPDV